MDFFKSILSDDSEHPKPEIDRQSDPSHPHEPPSDGSNSEEAAGGDPAYGWTRFGGLIKTLAVRSESVIETYRRDLQEFGSGLKKETELLSETASRVVKDLPVSLEASASAAHGALDGVLKSTAEIISRESRIFASDGEPDTPETNRSLNSGRYSWFEAQLSALQSDLNTFCEDPEDVEEYKKWKLGFELEEKTDEINNLIGENGTLEGVYKRIVPNSIDLETFWCRYFYRVDKLKQQESVRASLVRRATSADDEEELSWDFDDDDDDEEEEEEEEDGTGTDRTSGLKKKGEDGFKENVASDGILNTVEKQEELKSGSQDEKEQDNVKVDDGEKNNVVEGSKINADKDESFGKQEVKSGELMKSEENVKVVVEEKNESSKKVDASVVSSHPSKEDAEDMGWDEIEDIGSGDEKKILATTTSRGGGSPNQAELQKRLSAVEDDDDLNWDIEDDNEPVTA